MYKSILVPLDGSLFAEYALPIARSVAYRTGAAIQLVHVHVPVTARYAKGPVAYDETLEARYKERERAYLDKVSKRLEPGTNVQILSVLLDESGSIADTLNNHIKTTEVGLVVMATHGHGALSRFWLGSVADKLIRWVEKPILLVRPPEEVKTEPDLSQERIFRHILIPLDGSVWSEQILEHAVRLGKLMQADYTLVRIIEPVIPATYPRTDYTIWLEQQLLSQQQAEAQKAKAQTYLDSVAERLRLRSFQVQTKVIFHRHPATAILEEANKGGIDLIAMETHGYGGLRRLFIGSVADKVLRGTSIPVLLHRPYE
ncbi:MAG TPA: universal stress protein [Candidatus Limnocylindrales bacterium]|nr:universal stress protein [Candidatus Limnocylindrales bacterium]